MRISGTGRKKSVPISNVNKICKPVHPGQDKNETTRTYFPFIVQIARRMTRRLPSHIAIEDMVSAGLIGLMDCMDRYDPQKSDRFESYAEFRIRGAMLDELRASDPLSRDQRALINSFRSTQRQLEGILGRPPTSTEMAAELGQNLEKYNSIIAGFVQSSTVGSSEINSSWEVREISNFPNDVDNKKVITDCLQKINTRLRMVVFLYYYCDMNLKEIGRILNITESRVCQLHRQAMIQLRELMVGRQALQGRDFFSEDSI